MVKAFTLSRETPDAVSKIIKRQTAVKYHADAYVFLDRQFLYVSWNFASAALFTFIVNFFDTPPKNQ